MSQELPPHPGPPSDPLACWFCHGPVKVVGERDSVVIYACTACAASGVYARPLDHPAAEPDRRSDVLTRLRELKRRYLKLTLLGLEAIHTVDSVTLDALIKQEHAIIVEQRHLLNRLITSSQIQATTSQASIELAS